MPPATKLQIRAEKASDPAGIRAVHLAAFAPRPNEAELVDLLRQAGQATVSLVALSDGRLAGHILFSPVKLDPERGNLRGVGLAPLAVMPEFQGQGIGSRLVLRGLEACRAGGFDFVVVLGDPGYYGRFGFRRASGFGLDNEYGASQAFMALEMRPSVLQTLASLVRYQPEFKTAGA
jgi:putative acetyltransferase